MAKVFSGGTGAGKALDVKTRDSIGLAVSEVNGCNYCLTLDCFTAEHMARLP